MWNNYFSGRPRRDVPQVNYNESSEDEDDFRSPGRPPVTREGSPQPLAVPQLNDNVDEDLERVAQTLHNVGHTPLFKPEFGDDGVDEEEVVEEGHIVGVAASRKVEANPPPPPAPIMVNYDQQNEEDDQGAIANARDVKIPFNKHDIRL